MKKLAIITGATGAGIGRSAALALARDGFDIVVNYKHDDTRAQAVQKEVEKYGARILLVKGDIFKEKDCGIIIDESLREFNRIDALIIGPGADWNPEPPSEIDPSKVLNDTIRETSPIFSFLPSILPIMEKQNSGRIIGIASNSRIPSPSYSYNTAKEARISALLGIVSSCWNKKITVNIVAPGPVDHVDSLEKAISMNNDFSETDKKITPQDIAEIIAFLCSEKARYITGNVIGTYF